MHTAWHYYPYPNLYTSFVLSLTHTGVEGEANHPLTLTLPTPLSRSLPAYRPVHYFCPTPILSLHPTSPRTQKHTFSVTQDSREVAAEDELDTQTHESTYAHAE